MIPWCKFQSSTVPMCQLLSTGIVVAVLWYLSASYTAVQHPRVSCKSVVLSLQIFGILVQVLQQCSIHVSVVKYQFCVGSYMVSYCKLYSSSVSTYQLLSISSVLTVIWYLSAKSTTVQYPRVDCKVPVLLWLFYGILLQVPRQHSTKASVVKYWYCRGSSMVS